MFNKFLKITIIIILIFVNCTLLTKNCLALPYNSLTYLYGSTSPFYLNNVNRTKGNISTVVVDYFEIGSDGSAILNPWKKPDPLFIQTLQSQGIRVMAFVSNHWDRGIARKAMAKRYSVASTLAGWVETYGLDGLDVDIENLNHEDREDFTDFIQILSGLIPKNKSLSVAVAANPHRLTSGWHGMYDYPAMGRLCNTVMLMTYDQSYEGSPAGPVASYQFTKASVVEALRHIPREKLVMGIPFYGRYWASLNNGNKVNGKAFTVSDIDTMTKHYASRCWYDGTNQCARATVTVKSADPSIGLWGGKKLDAGTYDIWYEDDRSYATRMRLCREYGLAGIGSWALGQEPERIWKGYRLWLGGVPFTDLAGHWAEEAMSELYERGILSGSGEGTCSPGAKVTRAELCVLLCKLLGIPQSDPSAAPLEIRSHWAASYLWSAIKYGLIAGDGTHYRPKDNVTRAEMASMCYKALHVPNTVDFNQSFFPDVAPPMWFNNAVVTMRIYGIISGVPDGRFIPDGTATRAEASSVIYKMLNLELKDLTAQPRSRNPHRQEYVLEPR